MCLITLSPSSNSLQSSSSDNSIPLVYHCYCHRQKNNDDDDDDDDSYDDEATPILPDNHPSKQQLLGLSQSQHYQPPTRAIQRHFFQYNYRDHSQDTAKSLTEDEDEFLKTRHRHNGGVVVPFPLKLHNMLETIQEDGYSDVVSWLPHGRAFLVHKPKEFVQIVMPKYFKQTKMSSFQRQLNLYGFSRITTGRDRGGYYHELFLRGKSFLCRRMMRTRVKGTGVRMASNPNSEPNFYVMPHVLPPKKYQDGKKSGLIQETTEHFPSIPPTPPNMEMRPSSQVVPSNNPPIKSLPPPALQQPLRVPSSMHPLNEPKLMVFEGKPFHYLNPTSLENIAADSFLDVNDADLGVMLDHLVS